MWALRTPFRKPVAGAISRRNKRTRPKKDKPPNTTVSGISSGALKILTMSVHVSASLRKTTVLLIVIQPFEITRSFSPCSVKLTTHERLEIRR